MVIVMLLSMLLQFSPISQAEPFGEDVTGDGEIHCNTKLRVRSSPSTTLNGKPRWDNFMGFIPCKTDGKPTQIKIIGRAENGWQMVSYDGKIGYVSKDYAVLTKRSTGEEVKSAEPAKPDKKGKSQKKQDKAKPEGEKRPEKPAGEKPPEKPPGEKSDKLSTDTGKPGQPPKPEQESAKGKPAQKKETEPTKPASAAETTGTSAHCLGEILGDMEESEQPHRRVNRRWLELLLHAKQRCEQKSGKLLSLAKMVEHYGYCTASLMTQDAMISDADLVNPYGKFSGADKDFSGPFANRYGMSMKILDSFCDGNMKSFLTAYDKEQKPHPQDRGAVGVEMNRCIRENLGLRSVNKPEVEARIPIEPTSAKQTRLQAKGCTVVEVKTPTAAHLAKLQHVRAMSRDGKSCEKFDKSKPMEEYSGKDLVFVGLKCGSAGTDKPAEAPAAEK